MTDREEFEKWFNEEFGDDYTHTEAMLLAWQARGEIDAVRIKELEARLNDTKNYHIEWCGANVKIAELTVKNKELEDKLNELVKFHSSADKLAEKQVECIDKLAELTAKNKKLEVENHALGLIIDNEDKELADKIAELTSKLDKARAALSMASWNNIGGYEGQQKWMELNRELDKCLNIN